MASRVRRCTRERQAGDAVGEGAVAVEVAAGGEVSGERRRAFPHLAAAAGEAVVGGGELLVADDPQALAEEEEEQKRGEALRPADLDARNCHAADFDRAMFSWFSWRLLCGLHFECIALACRASSAVYCGK